MLDGEFTDEVAAKLADLYDARVAYMQAAGPLYRMKASQLRGGISDNEVSSYATLVVAPVRLELNQKMEELLADTVDIDKLKEMLPMAALAILNAVNLPLLLEVFGIDPDRVTELMDKVKEYINL